MTENVNVGQTLVYETVWFDGPNGTGNVVADPGQGGAVSDNPAVLTASESGQDVTVVGVTAGSANVQATSSTGVIAGSLDANGSYVAGPLPFLVAAVVAIVSGILRLKAAAGAALKRS